MRRIPGLFVLLALLAIDALADIRPPRTPPPTPQKTAQPAQTVDATMQIEFDPNEKTARLIIPRSRLKQLRAELEGLDTETGTAISAAGFTRAQTIGGGLFLTLAFVFGGVWFVRSGKAVSKKAKIAAAGAVLFFSGAFAIVAFGNIGPPLRASITSRIFNDKAFTHPLGIQGDVRLEVSDKSEWIKLVVPEVRETKPE